MNNIYEEQKRITRRNGHQEEVQLIVDASFWKFELVKTCEMGKWLL